jgi:very-short-patch-repair endonuclease
MRSQGAPAEQILWWSLRNRKLDGLKFRRQVPIGRFIADFYCTEFKLIVELDGDSHNEQVEYDQKRSAWLEERENHVIRFVNDDVLGALDGVLLTILRECGRDVTRM